MIKIGPAGSGLATLEGIREIKKLGFDAMEIEFTYGVKMSVSKAKEIGDEAKKLSIELSIHAPYYINLASDEKAKIKASEKRILDSCERGHYFGTKENPTPIVFHAGFYQGKDKEGVYRIIKESILKIQKEIKKNKWNVMLCPETTGKVSQFGDIDELIRLSEETGCSFTVDFAHMKARSNGNLDYKSLMEKLKYFSHIHCHFSGIEYTPKGEKRHLMTENKDIKELFSWIKKYKLNVTIINESPDPVGDSLKSLELRK
jgi:deoxyribonuclease-4